MELSFTYAPSPSPHRLMRFDHGFLSSHFPISTPSKHSHGGNSTSNAFRIRNSVPVVKPSLNSSSLRRTLSSNWDVLDNYSASSAPSLPRFEELDTTNMLLRQRIVFLGSQVISPTISSYFWINWSVSLEGRIRFSIFLGLNYEGFGFFWSEIFVWMGWDLFESE